MPTFYGAVDLIKNELRNAVVQNLGSAPASPVQGQIYYDSTAKILYWYNGTGWVAAQGGAGAVPSTTVTTQAVGDAPVVGTLTTYAREDHKHGREAFSGTVTADTTFGAGSAVGTATTLPHSDHSHGSPTHDATAHSALLGAVTAEPTFGSASSNGASTSISRTDHAHGNPTHLVTDHSGFLGAVTAEPTFGSASGNGAATTISRSDHAHGNPTHLAGDHSTISLSAFAVPTAALNLNNQNINNLADPTTPQQAATKNYVDNAIAGLSWKAPARGASTANIAALSGTMTLDGVALIVGDRVLVKNQTTASANGVYVVAAGAWARSTDCATAAQLLNMAVYVEEGTTQADTGWVMTTNAPITVGSTNLVYVQFTGAGTYNAGNGLALTGNVFSVLNADTSITVAGGGIAVNTAVIATQAYVNTAVTGVVKKYATTLAGTASPETITHNLNTRDIDVIAINGNSPYQSVQVDWQATTVNTVSIIYNPALGAGFRVVVQG
jgi:hypothetical protein